MRIDILTVVPELLDSPLSHSIVGRAIKKGLVEKHDCRPRGETLHQRRTLGLTILGRAKAKMLLG